MKEQFFLVLDFVVVWILLAIIWTYRAVTWLLGMLIFPFIYAAALVALLAGLLVSKEARERFVRRHD